MVHALIQVAAVLAAFGLVFVIGCIIISPRIDGPTASIVVVDRRTYRLAARRVEDGLADGELVRAYAGIAAIRQWLRREIHTGPKRRRVEYARALELWELRAEQFGPHTVI